MNTGRWDGEGGIILEFVPRPGERIQMKDDDPDLDDDIIVCVLPYHDSTGNYIYCYFEQGTIDERTGKPIVCNVPIQCERSTHCEG